jgi:hypothetical protein
MDEACGLMNRWRAIGRDAGDDALNHPTRRGKPGQAAGLFLVDHIALSLSNRTFATLRGRSGASEMAVLQKSDDFLAAERRSVIAFDQQCGLAGSVEMLCEAERIVERRERLEQHLVLVDGADRFGSARAAVETVLHLLSSSFGVLDTINLPSRAR